jgi:hypothetical protein
MSRIFWLFLAVAVVFGGAGYNLANAVPANPQPIAAAAQASSDVRQVYRCFRCGRWRWGGRYYGGTWYGAGRHWWNGRWYPYGVGECWRPSPIGFVWTCG